MSATPNDGATFFDAGQTSVLKVGAGGNFEATGAATWVPITDANGNPLPGIPTVTDGGITSVDGRAAADAVGATAFNRPEDLEIQTLADGTQRLYFGTTDTHKVWAVNATDPSAPQIGIFFDQSTIDAATGLPVGSAFMNPDNMAIDINGNIYVLEEIGNIAAGGPGFDIWFAFEPIATGSPNRSAGGPRSPQRAPSRQGFTSTRSGRILPISTCSTPRATSTA